MLEDLVQFRFLCAFQNYVQQEKEVGSKGHGIMGNVVIGHVIIEIS